MAEFRMPSLGADMEAGTLVAWRRALGETLKRGDIIAEVETDKGIIEVEVFSDGVLERYLVEAGHKVPVGTPLAVIAEPDNTTAVRPAAAPSTAPAESRAPAVESSTRAVTPESNGPLTQAPPVAAAPIAAPPSVRRRARELGLDLRDVLAHAQRVTMHDTDLAGSEREGGRSASGQPRSSPAARTRATELGLDLRQIRGSGPEGAIILSDVERAAGVRSGSVASGRLPQATSLPLPAAPPAPAPADATVSRARPDARAALRRAIGAAMARSKREIPHYYLSTTIDPARMMAWLTRYNAERGVLERLLPSVLLLKAVARAARDVPDLNSLWQDDAARVMPEVHLGVAIALRGGGLVAPAIHNADTLELPALMSKLQDLVGRARSGSLRSSELSDGTLTVTSLGERGVDSVYPIIYAPQTAIVGFGKIADRPWVSDSTVVVRPLITATLAADHRVTDGHLGARFLNVVDQWLQKPESL